jgi:hypothetical protein
MEEQKQQIVERLKQANNILVTVSANPSVDQLSAAIGFTLLLNKMGKQATAVFSGQVPSTLEFLQPEKTIEKNTDSLRDFIIALDKSKADKLRYKVEDSHVKIFITPYKTSITDKDLVFSQGDFNVEVVVALGVLDPKDLDQAITAHGRILHDATVISVSTQPGSNLGSMNWAAADASSLCEMLVGIGDLLGQNLLDDQMATAFLTGIVAETERFSNAKTSAVTMGASAKLMAAGANQQLIATKLEKPKPAPVEAPKTSEATKNQAGEASAAPTDKLDDLVKELDAEEKAKPASEEPVGSPDGSLQIDHGNGAETHDTELDELEPEEPELDQIHIDEQGKLHTGDELPATPPVTAPTDKPNVIEGPKLVLDPPSLGGTLTANAHVQGLDPSTDPMSSSQSDKPLLSHDSPVTKAREPAVELPQPAPDAPLPPAIETPADQLPAEQPAPPEQSLADLEKNVQEPVATTVTPVGDVGNARDAVMNAIDATHMPKLEPISALNANPVNLDLTQPDLPVSAAANASEQPGPELVMPNLPPPNIPVAETPAPMLDPAAPPPVPPPMMPPMQ